MRHARPRLSAPMQALVPTFSLASFIEWSSTLRPHAPPCWHCVRASQRKVTLSMLPYTVCHCTSGLARSLHTSRTLVCGVRNVSLHATSAKRSSGQYYLLRSERSTVDVACLLAEAAQKSDCYLLDGPLGCGKSSFRCVRLRELSVMRISELGSSDQKRHC